MTNETAVAFTALHLEIQDLLTALVPVDYERYLCAIYVGRTNFERGSVGDRAHGIKNGFLTRFNRELFNLDLITDLNKQLLAAGFKNSVCFHFVFSFCFLFAFHVANLCHEKRAHSIPKTALLRQPNTRLRFLKENDKISTVKKDKCKLKFKRILLKLSGEVLANKETGECIDPENLAFMAERIKKIHALGCEVGIVLGGGNIFRGLTGAGKGVNRVTGDSMGMLATIINALAMMNALETIGVPTRVMTSIEMPKLAEPFIQRKALRHFEKGRVCIFAGGTGNPYFSTDSAAALRASEIGADAVLKATKVDGIYTADPKKDPTAKKFASLKYEVALEKRLKVMDSAAFALCMDNEIPIIVFDFFDKKALERVVKGEAVGTIVR